MLDCTRLPCLHPLQISTTRRRRSRNNKTPLGISSTFAGFKAYKWLHQQHHQDVFRRVASILQCHLLLMQSLQLGSSSSHVVFSLMTSDWHTCSPHHACGRVNRTFLGKDNFSGQVAKNAFSLMSWYMVRSQQSIVYPKCLQNWGNLLHTGVTGTLSQTFGSGLWSNHQTC